MRPTCPICPGDRKLAKNGFNKSGTQRYCCTAKGCTYSETDGPRLPGRPLKADGTEAMTNADRQAEYRVRREEKRTIEPIDNQTTSPRSITMSEQNSESSLVKASQLLTPPSDTEYCPELNKSVSPLVYEERSLSESTEKMNVLLSDYFDAGTDSE